MRQIFVIHGGTAFDSYEHYFVELKKSRIDYERLKPRLRWSYWLSQQLPNDDVLAPTMPNSQNAQYEEWKILFEKLLPLFESHVTLIGHSLGAIFLAKYLSSHALPIKLDKLIFVSAPYDDEKDESLGSFRLQTQPSFSPTVAQEVHFLHAKDDEVVIFGELDKYRQTIHFATFHEFEAGNHFFGETFPELLDIINKK